MTWCTICQKKRRSAICQNDATPVMGAPDDKIVCASIDSALGLFQWYVYGCVSVSAHAYVWVQRSRGDWLHAWSSRCCAFHGRSRHALSHQVQTTPTACGRCLSMNNVFQGVRFEFAPVRGTVQLLVNFTNNGNVVTSYDVKAKRHLSASSRLSVNVNTCQEKKNHYRQTDAPPRRPLPWKRRAPCTPRG